MGYDGVASKDSGDFALLSKGHIEDEVMARHASDLEEFGVQGVVVDRPFGSHGIAHEARRVNDLDRLLRGQTGCDEFTASRETEHEMLLDEAERNVQIGFHKALIYIDRGATTSGS